jgi:hypothetical protein
MHSRTKKQPPCGLDVCAMQTQPGVWTASEGTNVIPLPFTIVHSKRKSRVDVMMSSEKDNITIDYAQCVCPPPLVLAPSGDAPCELCG